MNNKKEKGTKTSFPKAMKNTLRAWKVLWKACPQRFIYAVVYGIIDSATPYVAIWFSAQFINELAGARDPHTLWMWVIWILSSSAVLFLLSSFFQHLYQKYSYGTILDVYKIFQDKFLDMDFVDVDSQRVYDIKSQIEQDSNFRGFGLFMAMHSFDALVSIVSKIAGGIGLSISLFTSKVTNPSFVVLDNPFVCIGLFALLLGLSLLSSGCSNKAIGYLNRNNDAGKFGNRKFSFYFKLVEDKHRALDSRIYGQERSFRSFFCSDDDPFRVNGYFAKLAKGPMGVFQALSAVISRLLLGGIYLLVCAKAWGGAFGVGSVTQYVGASTALFAGISELIEQLGLARANSQYLDVVFSLLDIPNDMYQGSLTTEKRADRRYNVEFRDVSFKYPGSERYALRHVNMKFQVGKRLAVVGMNGSGKTTFIKLLCRLYDPTEGEILLNGIDIRKYRYDEYMDLFSVVFQDFKLFALPLGQNVASCEKYDSVRATDCLEKAGFGDRLSSLPKGLDTYLYKKMETDGIDVSGGEAQKIAIARALYKDSPFIILDEPTAALDPIAEAEIYSKFNGIVGDKTAVYISHRLSSCRFCDEIAVFDNGQVVQYGSHDELVGRCGKYQELWNAQAQYYAKKEVPVEGGVEAV